MSKSLVTLLDNSLLPACTMIFGKFIGIVLAIRFFNIPWNLSDYTNSILNVSVLLNKNDIATVTSYSDFVMYFFVAGIFGLNIARSMFLNSKNLDPNILLRLKKLNLLSLIESSYELYHRTFMWLIFTVISNILIAINFFMNKTYLWIMFVCTLTTLTLAFLFIQEIYKEFDDIRKHPGRYKWN